MPTLTRLLSAAVFVAAALLALQSRRAEDFDTSGMPRRPTKLGVTCMTPPEFSASWAAITRIGATRGAQRPPSWPRRLPSSRRNSRPIKLCSRRPSRVNPPLPLRQRGRASRATTLATRAGRCTPGTSTSTVPICLRPASAAGGFVTPGVGGRSTVGGGGEDSGSQRRRLKFVRSESGILREGMKLKPKSW